ncbi:hypothetical protein ABZP36_025798 [Zizania latifolia]
MVGDRVYFFVVLFAGSKYFADRLSDEWPSGQILGSRHCVEVTGLEYFSPCNALDMVRPSPTSHAKVYAFVPSATAANEQDGVFLPRRRRRRGQDGCAPDEIPGYEPVPVGEPSSLSSSPPQALRGGGGGGTGERGFSDAAAQRGGGRKAAVLHRR